MKQKSHDHNFKNVFIDFPKETLEWILPQAMQSLWSVKDIEFVRQEPKKHKHSERHFVFGYA